MKSGERGVGAARPGFLEPSRASFADATPSRPPPPWLLPWLPAFSSAGPSWAWTACERSPHQLLEAALRLSRVMLGAETLIPSAALAGWAVDTLNKGPVLRLKIVVLQQDEA
jgi:hypothetical protein